MSRVFWSREAQVDLRNIRGPFSLVEEIIGNAESTLHEVNCEDEDHSEGVRDGVMWHRGFTHQQQRLLAEGQLPDGNGPRAWDYVLYYSPLGSSRFEVRSVKGPGDIGRHILRML